jgi:hypothetical protein
MGTLLVLQQLTGQMVTPDTVQEMEQLEEKLVVAVEVELHPELPTQEELLVMELFE